MSMPLTIGLEYKHQEKRVYLTFKTTVGEIVVWMEAKAFCDYWTKLMEGWVEFVRYVVEKSELPVGEEDKFSTDMEKLMQNLGENKAEEEKSKHLPDDWGQSRVLDDHP